MRKSKTISSWRITCEIVFNSAVSVSPKHPQPSVWKQSCPVWFLCVADPCNNTCQYLKKAKEKNTKFWSANTFQNWKRSGPRPGPCPWGICYRSTQNQGKIAPKIAKFFDKLTCLPLCGKSHSWPIGIGFTIPRLFAPLG